MKLKKLTLVLLSSVLLRVRLDAAHGIKTETKKDKTDTTGSDITDG